MCSTIATLVCVIALVTTLTYASDSSAILGMFSLLCTVNIAESPNLQPVMTLPYGHVAHAHALASSHFVHRRHTISRMRIKWFVAVGVSDVNEVDSSFILFS